MILANVDQNERTYWALKNVCIIKFIEIDHLLIFWMYKINDPGCTKIPEDPSLKRKCWNILLDKLFDTSSVLWLITLEVVIIILVLRWTYLWQCLSNVLKLAVV